MLPHLHFLLLQLIAILLNAAFIFYYLLIEAHFLILIFILFIIIFFFIVFIFVVLLLLHLNLFISSILLILKTASLLPLIHEIISTREILLLNLLNICKVFFIILWFEWFCSYQKHFAILHSKS
jgi:hypothetical protein